MTSDITQAFCARYRNGTEPSSQTLATALQTLVAQAHAAWPQLKLDRVPFIEHVAERVPLQCEQLPAWLAELRAGDLYLAYGCAAGNDAALRAFDEAFRATTLSTAERVRSAEMSAEDAVQKIWQTLLVAQPERPAAITRYSGRGALRNWLLVTVRRALIDLNRSARPHAEHELRVDDEQLWALPDPGGDPELGHLRETYAKAFRHAFQQSVDALTATQRNLLRQHFIYKLTVDQLGALYHVHRSTAARQLAAARDALLSGTRRTLRRELEVNRSTMESVLRLIDSRVDISLDRLLASSRARSDEGQ